MFLLLSETLVSASALPGSIPEVEDLGNEHYDATIRSFICCMI